VNSKFSLKKIGYYIVSLPIALAFLFPFYWAVVNAFKPRAEVLKYPPTLFAKQPTLESFINLFTAGNGNFLFFTRNSFLVSIGTVLLTGVACTLAGYALSKLKFPGINIIFVLILSIMMVPFQALLIPLYTLMHDLGLLDTKVALVILFSTFRLPIGTFIMRNSFASLPESLRESAMLDGASEVQILTRIFMPLAWPGLLTVVLLAFMRSWNNFLIPLVFTTSKASQTLQVGLVTFAKQRFYTNWSVINAGSVAGMIPVLILFVFLQKYFVRGMLAGVSD